MAETLPDQESRADDRAREARRQSLLVGRRNSERETLDFIEQGRRHAGLAVNRGALHGG